MDDKPALKEASSGTHDYFDDRNHISGTAEARVAKFCMQVEYIKC